MLGSIKSRQPWQWSASGKHPAMKDFFHLGDNDPLVMGFSKWVQSGFQQAGSPKDPSSFYSWRFWAKGLKKENLACGIVRDSSDSLGRPYPILVMGIGPLNGWENSWDLLPSACETTWNQMEYVSTRMFQGLKQMEEEVQKIQPPFSAWNEIAGKKGDFGELENQVFSMNQEKEFFIPLDQKPLDPSAWIRFWHFRFKKAGEGIPSALFMGGTLANAFLAVFKRPLVSSDFVRLWSLSSAEQKTATGQ
jgi:type VI secretion system protein VasJ